MHMHNGAEFELELNAGISFVNGLEIKPPHLIKDNRSLSLSLSLAHALAKDLAIAIKWLISPTPADVSLLVPTFV